MTTGRNILKDSSGQRQWDNQGSRSLSRNTLIQGCPAPERADRYRLGAVSFHRLCYGGLLHNSQPMGEGFRLPAASAGGASGALWCIGTQPVNRPTPAVSSGFLLDAPAASGGASGAVPPRSAGIGAYHRLLADMEGQDCGERPGGRRGRRLPRRTRNASISSLRAGARPTTPLYEGALRRPFEDGRDYYYIRHDNTMAFRPQPAGTRAFTDPYGGEGATAAHA